MDTLLCNHCIFWRDIVPCLARHMNIRFPDQIPFSLNEWAFAAKTAENIDMAKLGELQKAYTGWMPILRNGHEMKIATINKSSCKVKQFFSKIVKITIYVLFLRTHTMLNFIPNFFILYSTLLYYNRTIWKATSFDLHQTFKFKKHTKYYSSLQNIISTHDHNYPTPYCLLL